VVCTLLGGATIISTNGRRFSLKNREEYSPHYYVSQEVIDNDHAKQLSGWAHSEENFNLENEGTQKDLIFDTDGRPLNPHGRTGIAGRGLLGRWGPNPVLLPLIVRVNPISNDLELLLVEHNSDSIGLLTDFINLNQTQEEAIQRLFQNKLKIDSKIAKKVNVFDGYLYDSRQTDHAWIQAHCVAYFMPFDIVRDTFTIEESSELKWRKIDTEIINKMPSSHAMIIRNSIEKLNSNDLISDEITNALIKLSG
jgi:ADP-ribose pyrophosphatase